MISKRKEKKTHSSQKGKSRERFFKQETFKLFLREGKPLQVCFNKSFQRYWHNRTSLYLTSA